MDDRILFVPPVFAPDPDVVGRWPAVRVFLQRVQEIWPVDVVRLPTIKGESGEFPAALAGPLKPQHHIVAYSLADIALPALSAQPPRSLTTTSFVASRGTMLASGGSLAASSAQMMFEVSLRPAQLLPSLFQGADVAQVDSILAEVEETRDRAMMERVVEAMGAMTDHTGRWVIDVPALYLASAAPLPGREGMENVFRTFFPRARSDELTLWGVRMHDEAAGHEFADKVVAFVEEVIAEREATKHT